jgi:hypothetical protein
MQGLQMVTDDVLALKATEIKSYLLKYFIPIADNQNPTSLLWLLRKKLKVIDPLTPK